MRRMRLIASMSLPFGSAGSVIGHGRIDVQLQVMQWNFFTECFNPFGGTIEHFLQQRSPLHLPQDARGRSRPSHTPGPNQSQPLMYRYEVLNHLLVGLLQKGHRPSLFKQEVPQGPDVHVVELLEPSIILNVIMAHRVALLYLRLGDPGVKLSTTSKHYDILLLR